MEGHVARDNKSFTLREVRGGQVRDLYVPQAGLIFGSPGRQIILGSLKPMSLKIFQPMTGVARILGVECPNF